MIQKIKQCFNNIKYRSKLILLCILVSFLPLSVMGFFCYNQTQLATDVVVEDDDDDF